MPHEFPTVGGVQVLLPPPRGYDVDLAHPQRNGDTAVYWAFGIGNLLALLLLGQRLYTKIVLSTGLQRDDVFIILSWVTSEITQCILLYEFVEGIEGVHGWELTIDKFKTYLLLSWIGPWVYVLCGSFAKLSLLTVCFRLSPFGWFRVCTIITLAIVVCHTVVLVSCMIFSCYPVRKSWDINFPPTEGRCLNVVALYLATAIANIITDAILMIIPIPLILSLNMPKLQKPGVLVVFMFGSATVVTSIVRCAYLPSLLHSKDTSWIIARPSVWAIIEANLVIICASTTTLRRFLYHIAPSMMGESRGTSCEQRNTTNTPKGNLHVGSPVHAQAPQRWDKYFRFGDDQELFTLNIGTLANAEAAAQSRDDLSGVSRDTEETGSETGIVQTKTVAVTYSEPGHG